jgi:hypothetical protein
MVPVPAAIAGTVANAINKTMPIQRYTICASFDPARNETCACARTRHMAVTFGL